jgi:hypothetical protein
MLDANLKTQLQAYLERVTLPIEITATLDDSDSSREMLELLNEITELSARISLKLQRDGAERAPSFAINRAFFERRSGLIDSDLIGPACNCSFKYRKGLNPLETLSAEEEQGFMRTAFGHE